MFQIANNTTNTRTATTATDIIGIEPIAISKGIEQSLSIQRLSC